MGISISENLKTLVQYDFLLNNSYCVFMLLYHINFFRAQLETLMSTFYKELESLMDHILKVRNM